MIKSISRIMLACLGFIIFSNNVKAQNVPITFEPGQHGYAWTWSAFENATNLAPQMVANPNPSGINTSPTVVSMTTLIAGNAWAGFESAHGAGIGTFTLSASNAIVKLMVYKSVVSDVGVKFALPNNAALIEIKVPNTLTNQWEELTFDFSSRIGNMNTIGQDQIIIYPDFQPRTTDNTCYIDNVTFHPVTAPTMPTVAAPNPTALQANVISMFSNTYTNNVPVDTWLTGWSQGTLVNLQIAGNDTKKYDNVTFVAAETTGPNLIDATAMNTFNVDVWTPNMTSFNIKLVDWGANGVWNNSGVDDVEHELTFTPIIAGWNSYHIPLANFTGLITRAHMSQLIFSGLPAGTSTFYIDNVYYSYVPQQVPMVAAPTPTATPANVISMFSGVYPNVPVDTWLTGWSQGQLTDLLIQGDPTKRYFGLNFVGIETVGPNLIDATAMNMFNVDVWTPNMDTFRIKLVDWGANGVWNNGGVDDVEHELAFTPTLSGWNSYHIPLSAFTGLTTRAHMSQLIFSGTPSGTGDVYIDNVYYSFNATLPVSLTNFTAELSNGPVHLNWATTDEKNVESFEAQRSRDGINFETIATVAAKNELKNHYSLTDNNPISTTYYRIKMNDQDGKIAYSEVKRINVHTKAEVSIYPNPATDEIFITSGEMEEKGNILSLFGQTIGNFELNNFSTRVNIRNYSPGIYFIQFSDGQVLKFDKK